MIKWQLMNLYNILCDYLFIDIIIYWYDRLSIYDRLFITYPCIFNIIT